MKATGIVRNLDNVGRVVIPAELRETMEIGGQDPLEFFVDDDKIVLRKYQPGCILCGNDEGLHSFHGKLICSGCITKAAKLHKSN